ncbi:hypothetical protein JAB9_47590 [Janthinobacterium sp. HH107]|uniref:hypothetical protein n=1 Tax=Janthinobacterium sp. HH107 TaxID=1537279 RepID=UPI000874CFC8|nr:hypothetical protein [Janthinobacterium sp. HH107]OEZ92192.1 hypothetical protein JAB9_47590 [Janthinobacterium sp. HH107]
MDTLKIVSTDLRTQGPFVVINKSDFNPDVHELYGDDNDLGAPTERAPTMAELLAARDQLLERERELAAEKDRVAEQAQANEAEAQRLRDEAVSLQAAKDAAVAAAQSQVAPATATAEKAAKAAKA